VCDGGHNQGSINIIKRDFLVTDFTEGLRVVDLSIASRPREVGFIDTPGFTFDVVPWGNLALVANGIIGLRILDTGGAALSIREPES
jgi:hypothetical protein